jgi:hypothetical protein
VQDFCSNKMLSITALSVESNSASNGIFLRTRTLCLLCKLNVKISVCNRLLRAFQTFTTSRRIVENVKQMPRVDAKWNFAFFRMFLDSNGCNHKENEICEQMFLNSKFDINGKNSLDLKWRFLGLKQTWLCSK